MRLEVPVNRWHVLLVDDDEADAFLTREAFRDDDPSVQVHCVRDGREALTFLRREATHQRAPRPDLVLLDLNMPGMSGHEFLVDMRCDLAFAGIPVVVMSTSALGDDVDRAYAAGANGYMTKPDTFAKLRELARSLRSLWLEPGALVPPGSSG